MESDLVDPQGHESAPHIAPNHIESGTGRLLEYQTVAADGVTSPKHRFRAGQVLYSKIRPYLAKAALVDFEGLCSADMYPVRSDIEARFLHRWLISHEFTALASGQQGRTVLPKINQEALSRLPVPVPPLNEQRRIVAKIETLNTRSRAARDALEQIPALLERLRRSVLATAFRGDLTADWRKRNPKVEPASVLLERIRAERRRRWEEAELASMRAKGKAPKNDKWKGRYEEPDPVDTRGLPELPRGWCWARFEDIGDLLLGRRRAPEYESEEIEAKYLRVANVKSGSIDQSDVLAMRWSREDAERFRLCEGDILISEGQSLERIGQSALVTEREAGLLFQSTLHRLRPYPTIARSDYAQLVSLSATATGLFRRYASITTNIAHLPANKLKQIPFPLCPLEEQRVMAARATAALNLITRQQAQCDALRERVGLLEQSILAKAFRGELVPQDPKDEPASVLLERIRAERARETAGLRQTQPCRTRRKEQRQVAGSPENVSPPPPTPPSRPSANGTWAHKVRSNGMLLKAVLDSLKRDALHRIADAHEIELANRRSLDAAREGLTGGDVPLEAVLEHLDREELKAICRALSLEDRGRTKEELRTRIMEAQGTWAP